MDMDDFIERLCENKDVPEMACNGQCHLKKVVQNTNSTDDLPMKMVNFEEILLFVVENESFKPLLNINFNDKEFNYHNLYNYILSYSLDHPPKRLNTYTKV